MTPSQSPTLPERHLLTFRITKTHLPTQFMEAQLDYFGQHMYESKDDPMRGVQKGEHHYEWKPAKGSSDK
jgi:6-phosphogluconate dehydrogenase